MEKENLTLEDILNEENILMELKMSSANKFAKLYPFSIYIIPSSVIKAPTNYNKMIDYIK